MRVITILSKAQNQYPYDYLVYPANKVDEMHEMYGILEIQGRRDIRDITRGNIPAKSTTTMGQQKQRGIHLDTPLLRP